MIFCFESAISTSLLHILYLENSADDLSLWSWHIGGLAILTIWVIGQSFAFSQRDKGLILDDGPVLMKMMYSTVKP
jgi:hypothetical protein